MRVFCSGFTPHYHHSATAPPSTISAATVTATAISLISARLPPVCTTSPTWLSFLYPLGGATGVQTRPSSSSSRWKRRQGSDQFARDAKVQGLKSRAAFKLLEVCPPYLNPAHSEPLHLIAISEARPRYELAREVVEIQTSSCN